MPYIIQIAAIAISVMQIPKVNITDLFNSKDKIANNGIGMALTATKVFKTIFVLEIRLGSIISHAAMIEAAAISDHDKLSEVKYSQIRHTQPATSAAAETITKIIRLLLSDKR